MFGYYKKTMFSFIFLCVQGLCGMHSQGVLAGYLPEGAIALGNAGFAFVSANFSSAVTTVQNKVSDSSAFAKLGFPPTDSVRQAELDRFALISKRYHDAILANKIIGEEFVEDGAYINRRREYVKRAINSLLTYEHSVQLALFCLKNYQSVMDSFEISRVTIFLQHKQQKSVEKMGSLSTELNQVAVQSNNPLLLSLLGNSSSVQKEEEKKEDKRDSVDGKGMGEGQ